MTIIPVKVARKSRRYDKERGCYVYDISFKTASELTERTFEVAEAFGLGVDEDHEHILYDDFELRLTEGDVVYITGDSGSGKSVLLRALKDDLGDEAASMEELEFPEDVALIDSIGSSFQDALKLLSLVGLNDAFLFLRKPGELSDGQRYRYNIAQLIISSKKFWLCDEFCSTLDRTTAKIVSYNFQKLARMKGSTLVVATTHDDLLNDLNPSIHIQKGWGAQIKVDYLPDNLLTRCSVVRDVLIRESNKEEYKILSSFHYREAKAPVPFRFYAMVLDGELIGVIVYSYPPVHTKGRKQAVGYTPGLTELNLEWAQISRVVIHPKYRSIGLGIKLVRETLPLQGRQHVELTAVMAQYNPFAEKAGMRLILVSTPHPSVLKALEVLRRHGFNPSLLSSRKYNAQKIEKLDDIMIIHEILMKVKSQYYKRLSRRHKAYITRQEFNEWLPQQDLRSLSHTLKILSTLGQTKAYLYWNRGWGSGV